MKSQKLYEKQFQRILLAQNGNNCILRSLLQGWQSRQGLQQNLYQKRPPYGRVPSLSSIQYACLAFWATFYLTAVISQLLSPLEMVIMRGFPQLLQHGNVHVFLLLASSYHHFSFLTTLHGLGMLTFILLADCELYLVFVTIFRRLVIHLEGTRSVTHTMEPSTHVDAQDPLSFFRSG